METQFNLYYWLLWGVVISIGLATIAMIVVDLIRSLDFTEVVLRAMVVAAGVILTSVSVFSGKPLPEMVARSMLETEPFSLKLALLGYLLPILLGLAAGIFLVSTLSSTLSDPLGEIFAVCKLSR